MAKAKKTETVESAPTAESNVEAAAEVKEPKKAKKAKGDLNEKSLGKLMKAVRRNTDERGRKITIKPTAILVEVKPEKMTRAQLEAYVEADLKRKAKARKAAKAQAGRLRRRRKPCKWRRRRIWMCPVKPKAVKSRSTP